MAGTWHYREVTRAELLAVVAEHPEWDCTPTSITEPPRTTWQERGGPAMALAQWYTDSPPPKGADWPDYPTEDKYFLRVEGEGP